MRFLFILLFLVGCSDYDDRPLAKFNIGDEVIVLRDGWKNCKYATVETFRQSDCCGPFPSWSTTYRLTFTSPNNANECPSSEWFGEKFLVERNYQLDYEAEAKRRGFR